MARYDSLMYSAVIDADDNTAEGFRRNMILMVLDDQGSDTRDIIVALAYHRRQAEKQGIDMDKIFKEMADIASTEDKYGWGSMRELFLNH